MTPRDASAFTAIVGLASLSHAHLLLLQLSVRARGTAAATLMNWVQNAIIGKVAPLLLAAIGSYTYALFAVLCAAMTLFTLLLVPETQGVSLEDMDALFRGSTRQGGGKLATTLAGGAAEGRVGTPLGGSSSGRDCERVTPTLGANDTDEAAVASTECRMILVQKDSIFTNDCPGQ
jgi:hypothetical protein